MCRRLGQRAGTVVAVLEMVGAQRDTHVTYLTFWVPDGVLRPPPPSDFAAATGIGRLTCKREPCTMPSVLIGDSSSATPRIVRLEPEMGKACTGFNQEVVRGCIRAMIQPGACDAKAEIYRSGSRVLFVRACYSLAVR